MGKAGGKMGTQVFALIEGDIKEAGALPGGNV